METGGAVTFKAPKNLVWKIGALVIAALLWIAVSSEPDLVTTRAVPILYRNLAPQYLLTGEIPDSVRVEVRGSEAQLSSTALAETVALFDLGAIDGTGEQTFTIADSNLNLPRGVTFLRAVPSQLRLRVARLASKDVPVDVRVDGEVAPGYRLLSATAEPGSLRIAGSENRVSAISRVETDTVQVAGLSQSGERRVNAFVSDPEVRFESSPIVSVKLAIERIGN
jgi:YbbR domain-containing protein